MAVNLLDTAANLVGDAFLAAECQDRIIPLAALSILRENDESQRAESERVTVISDGGDLRRLRWTIGSRRIDCFVASMESYKRQISIGAQHHLIAQLARGRKIQGSRDLADSLQAIARLRLEKSPAAVPPKVVSAMGYQAEDLLATFRAVAVTDANAAALTLAAFVGTCVDCYFATNRLWATAPSKTIEIINKHNPAVAGILCGVLSMPVSVLSSDPSLLDSLVAATRAEPPELNLLDYKGPAKGPKVPLASSLDGRILEAVRSYKRGLEEPPSSQQIITA
jgi:hypothetical protein